jgi:hypothetical protein
MVLWCIWVYLGKKSHPSLIMKVFGGIYTGIRMVGVVEDVYMVYSIV